MLATGNATIALFAVAMAGLWLADTVGGDRVDGTPSAR